MAKWKTEAAVSEEIEEKSERNTYKFLTNTKMKDAFSKENRTKETPKMSKDSGSAGADIQPDTTLSKTAMKLAVARLETEKVDKE
ncbi:hypothetical protein KIL84_013555 [Mauremys mutica]|uniref:Uncharacterized protein n=1 Tax=Mauremys mutica TaxID=74926 RepID=A0A9D3WXU7_9SAUR|nr:hypothetical protein KIL84_013555 [Mauremys mutica]